MRSLLLAFAAFALCATTSAALAEPTVIEIADEYLQLYLSGDIDGCREYWTEDSYFRDTIMEAHGAAEIHSKLTSVFEDFEITGFDREHGFQSGADGALFTGMLRLDYAGEPLGVPGRRFQLRCAFAMAVRLRDGKVLEHIDYFDGEAFMEQVRKQSEGD